MTTRSPSIRPNPTAIPGGEAHPADSVPPDTPPPGTAVDGLVRAAVADRPLEELAELITLLEQSPASARAASDALRTAGVDRSVEDVTRLVTLLTRPPRPAEGADEIIRAAAERRPVEDVTHLMALLHRTPLEPHCEEEALRTAATRRPVEELAELIDRLSEAERAARTAPDRTVVGTAPPPDYDPTAAPTTDSGVRPGSGSGVRPGSDSGTGTDSGTGSRFRPGSGPDAGSRFGGRRSSPAGETGPAHRAYRSDAPAPEEPGPRRPRRWKRGSTDPAPEGGAHAGARAKSPRGMAVHGELPRAVPIGSSRTGTAYDDEETARLATAAHRRAPDRSTRRAARLTALLLLGTGAATLPLHRDGESPQIYGLVLGAALACTILGVLLTIRPAVPTLALTLLVPAALAAGQLLHGRMGPASLTRAMDLTAAPGWLAGGVAACAALASLTTLLLAAQPTQGR
ncbi:hypothetical protein [Streptomyces acidiscabies]|uniref:Uncharacterized protein n=1 Tax=Streptomyces acidiscabies TaxID=42234 RepID=A0AAP6ECN7_9ACTN|nr:hypothetical protein [Streptomyces acidiscabies]MDX2958517.1 hypothetical protein [Streptomyces acidiscabies]MDX3020977.1 hypothetical protein [Streptomyces acidiscabies]MDX3795020.1 hypothetical protein [Streptomyces acidiscabies]GAV40949.1 hypothetical protein Saa2_03849 [Streptomyces acidiscabies]